jgi:hypothetical protein
MDSTVTDSFGTQIKTASDGAVGLLTDNVLYLLALPGAWVAYKVVRKVIAKIG